MPAALLLAAAAVLVLALARSREAQLQASGAYLGDLPIDEAIDAPLAEPVASSFAGAVFSAGQAVLDTMGQAVSKIWTIPARGLPYAEAIHQAEVKHGLPPNLLARLLYEESRFRADIIDGATVSRVGAQGIAQFMPGTARDLGIDPIEPAQAIPAAAKYLRSLFDQLGTWSEALAAYNWGIGNVKRKGIAAAPAETRNYVARITADVGIDS